MAAWDKFQNPDQVAVLSSTTTDELVKKLEFVVTVTGVIVDSARK
jgi:hypothetical protein